METMKWFDRKFDFPTGMEKFPVLMEYLEKSPSNFSEITHAAADPDLNFKPGGKWAVKEHIGHLYILEPLWQRRFLEIRENKTEMSPADLNNKATDAAQFNRYNAAKIIAGFREERENTIALLKSLREEDFLRSSYHPRLKQPMKITDLMHFVAEHDEHHLKSIWRIMNNLTRA